MNKIQPNVLSPAELVAQTVWDGVQRCLHIDAAMNGGGIETDCTSNATYLYLYEENAGCVVYLCTISFVCF